MKISEKNENNKNLSENPYVDTLIHADHKLIHSIPIILIQMILITVIWSINDVNIKSINDVLSLSVKQ